MVGLLNREHWATDFFLYSCVELAGDVLGSRQYRAQWISRDENTVCDGLARSAVESGHVSIECGEGYESHRDGWVAILEQFQVYFT